MKRLFMAASGAAMALSDTGSSGAGLQSVEPTATTMVAKSNAPIERKRVKVKFVIVCSNDDCD
jgi:hypothetical protein